MVPIASSASTRFVLARKRKMSAITYNRVDVDGFGLAFREAGPANLPALLLLHGFPTSSHMFRNLIPKLADRYRVIARFTEVLKLHRFAVYVFDYGSPTGLRMAVEHPERVTAIITQNGNAYVEGLSDGWNPIRAYWKEPTQANRDALRTLLTPETTYWQYTTGVKNTSMVSPDGYNLDNYYMTRAGAHEVQLDLFLDYATNVEMYPKFQEYFRRGQPPLLAVWGKGDPFFLPPGAEAFRRDIRNAKIMFFDTGHFALETHCDEIAAAIRDFLLGLEANAPRGA